MRQHPVGDDICSAVPRRRSATSWPPPAARSDEPATTDRFSGPRPAWRVGQAPG